MRRGYRNRWERDNLPQSDYDHVEVPSGMVVVTDSGGRWHHEHKPATKAAKAVRLTAVQRDLIKYGWLPTS